MASARHVFIRPPDASFQGALGQRPDQSPIDVALACAQHRLLAAALRAAGCTVSELPAAPGHPDACFVQDIALLLPGLAILARPAEPSRQAEVELFRPFLSPELAVASIQAPGTLEIVVIQSATELKVRDHPIGGRRGRDRNQTLGRTHG